MVVDDNSPDGTGKRLDEIAADNPKLKIIHRPSKLGIGSAHQLCLMYAIHHGYDRLVTMDADMSHDPADIPRLLEKLETADFVIGSRYAKGGASEYTGYRRFLSVTANSLVRLVLQLPIKEFTTSLRAFDVTLLKKSWHAKAQTNGYSFFMETVFRLHRSGFRITEVPIYFKDRAAGISKIPRLEIFNGGIKLLQLGAIAYLGFKDTPPPADVHDTCHHCQSSFLAENSEGDKIIMGSEANTASVEGSHRGEKIKPRVVQCFECGSLHVHQDNINLNQLVKSQERMR
jgi:dolichol-phosphate mannosyltransferase